jgi:hypothetical protein
MGEIERTVGEITLDCGVSNKSPASAALAAHTDNSMKSEGARMTPGQLDFHMPAMGGSDDESDGDEAECLGGDAFRKQLEKKMNFH